MKKLLSILLVTAILFAEESSNYFVDNFLKYSTFYTSVSLNSPFTPAQKFAVDIENGTFVETTEETELSYNFSLGIRKFNDLIGRSDLLDKQKGIEHWKINGLDFSKIFINLKSKVIFLNIILKVKTMVCKMLLIIY